MSISCELVKLMTIEKGEEEQLVKIEIDKREIHYTVITRSCR